MMSTSSANIPSEKAGIYLPLPGFRKLNLDNYSLHEKMREYVLTDDQFSRCGFPIEDPEEPGSLLITDGNRRLASGIFRRCIRCFSDGTYSTADFASSRMCRYHLRPGQPHFPCYDEGCYFNGYHVTTECPLRSIRFFRTKKKRCFSSSVYGLDCEMIYTTAGMEVAKVGVVGANGVPVYESFVRPENQILDYNTDYSGITEKDLEHVTTTISDVQDYLLKLLNEDTILVGHGLENYLHALRLIHRKVVDTSELFEYGYKGKKSLKNLAQEMLNKKIKKSSSGHSCIEDARTCMELFLYRIDLDLQERTPVTQVKNKDSILQNTSVPASQPVEINNFILHSISVTAPQRAEIENSIRHNTSVLASLPVEIKNSILQDTPFPETQPEKIMNSILQNTSVLASLPFEFSLPTNPTVSYSCCCAYNCITLGIHFHDDSIFSDVWMPQDYQIRTYRRVVTTPNGWCDEYLVFKQTV